MNKIEVFFYLECAAVLIGLGFFAWRYLNNREQSNFRDDIWKNKPKGPARDKARAAFEDQVDNKILLEHKPDPNDQEERTEKVERSTAPPYRVPNFRGKPHDILGIPATADAELVGKAHKYWIKRYHPDRVSHLGGTYVEQARRRAEQLNTARQELLRLIALRK
jgi:hypothetical protein